MADIQKKIELYRNIGSKAVDYTTSFMLPDGGYIWDGYVNNAYHKQAYSWMLAGRLDEAHQLLNWAKENTLQPDGNLKDYVGDVYKLAWFLLSAHRLGHFDISYPVMSYMLSHQAKCGGFPRFAGDDLIRAVATSWMGITALSCGNLQVAKQAGACCISMLEQQPDPNRFYYFMTNNGELVTEKDHPKAKYIDIAQPKQNYYEVGIPMMLMCHLHKITGESSYLDYAKRCFEFHLNCYEDSFTYVGSGKSALAGAIYYSITGDQRGLDAAQQFCDFLVETQLPDGSWIDTVKDPDELLYYVDHAACFTVWLYEIASTLELTITPAPACTSK